MWYEYFIIFVIFVVVDETISGKVEAILYRVYNISLSGSKLRKLYYVRALERELGTNLGKYEAFVKTL